MQAGHWPVVIGLLTSLLQTFPIASHGQEVTAGEKVQSATVSTTDLTPQKRKLALSMLKLSEAEGRSLPADLQSYALMQVARGYARLQPLHATRVLADAFAASYAVSDYNNNGKPNVQADILLQLLPLDQTKVMELLPAAENYPREMVTLKLLRKDIQAKKLDEAAEMVEQMSSWTDFPYREGGELMKAFPSDQSSRRGLLFSQALACFSAKRFQEGRKSENNDGFAELIINNWRDLPPGSVEVAIDEVLKQAKANTKHRYMTLPASEGESLNFDSVYQLRLFQLLPILKQLNEIKAERILQDEQLMGNLLSKYPKGPESLFPEQDGALKRVPSAIPSLVSTFPAPGIGRYDKLQAEAKRIVASAGEDPAHALAQAEMLPVEIKIIEAYTPIRADALRGVAIASLKNKPIVAKQAVADMVDGARELTEPSDQVFQLIEAARLSVELGDQDPAKGALETATSKANDAVKKDEDRDDPNLSFKAYWPSTVAWQALLHAATRISPAYAQKLTHEIWDDQIRVLATIALADELARAPLGRTTMMQRFAHHGYYHDAKVYASNDDH